jgi:hypothetical protein
MRNPFRRKRSLRGAKGEWDASERILGRGYVAIPADRLPPDVVARARRAGIKVCDVDGEPCVAVNMTQVCKDVEQAADDVGEVVEVKIDRETQDFDISSSPGFSQAQVVWAFYRAVNDADNWVDLEDAPATSGGEEEPLYSFMRIDLTTGFIGEPPE